jgi:serine-type D-Ala-D-Ala carboxypeptidase (penicillin-binding protein 5/6)
MWLSRLRRDQQFVLTCLVMCCLLLPGWHPIRFWPVSDEPVRVVTVPKLLPLSNAPEIKNSSPLTSLDAQLSAKAVYVMDVPSSSLLYQKASQSEQPPASLAKMMSALVATELIPVAQKISISPEITQEGTLAGLQTGEQYSRDDILKAALVASGNDAADQLALSAGGRAKFVNEMNTAARELGLKQTTFLNATGLDEEAQHTTARDLAVLTKNVRQQSLFKNITSSPSVIITDQLSGRSLTLKNTNQLLGQLGVTGTKTGTTEAAGENLALTVERDGRELIIVILGSRQRYQDAQLLIRSMFDTYRWEPLSGLSLTPSP